LKLALITGATKGIGRSTAQTFAKAGWDLILLARDIQKLQDLKNELSINGVQINIVVCDLSQSDMVDQYLNECIKSYGCPTVVINNAGFAFNGELVSMPLNKWQRNNSSKSYKCFSNMFFCSPSDEK
tara:strand:- start:70 stop:450 length:381 start_codon:yes stop_codon:yes gene_type:complete